MSRGGKGRLAVGRGPRGNQANAIKTQPVTGFFGETQMGEMNRIERSAQKTEGRQVSGVIH
jgi:hypothetical protein